MKTLKEIATEVADLVERKDHDYDGAFKKSYNEYGMYTYCIRIQDKLNRCKALTIGKYDKQLVKDESLKDTITDVLGYSLLMLSILEERENNHDKSN